MSIFKAIRQVLTLSCEESARIVSASLDQELSRSERLAVRLHALCCTSCRRFRRQIMFLRDAVHQRAADITVDGPSLSPEARQRITRSLRSGEPEDSS